MAVASRTTNAKRNMFGALIQRLVGIFCPFLVRTVMIYYWGSLYLGLSGLFTSILQVLSLAELGFGEAMVFSMYKPLAHDDVNTVNALLKLYKKIYFIIGIVVLILGIAFLPFLPKMIKGEFPSETNILVLYLIYLINTTLSYFLFAYKSSLLVADQRSDIKDNIGTLCSTIMYIFQVLALVFTRNYYIYCVVLPISTLLNNILVELYTRKKYSRFFCEGILSAHEIRDIKKRVFGLFIYKVCGVFRNSFDSIIISAFLGLTVLAQYQNYYFILNSIVGFMSIITSSIVAGVGNSIVSETKDKNYNDFVKFQFIYMWITSWCTVCLCCLYQPFMKIWVGENLMFNETIMIVFCIYFFTSQMGNICYVYRQAAGLWGQDKYRPIVEALTNLCLNVVLVRRIGVSGVLLSTIICLIFINCIWGSSILFKHYFTQISVKYYLARLLFFAFTCTVSATITKWICEMCTINGIQNLIYRSIICILVPNAVIILLSSKLPECKNSIDLITKLILRKK